MRGLANQLPSRRLGAPSQFGNDCRNVRNMVQNTETSNQVKRIVGKGHEPTDIRLDIFEFRILEFASRLENGHPLCAFQNRLKFIPISAPKAKNMLKRQTTGEMAETVPPVPRMVGI